MNFRLTSTLPNIDVDNKTIWRKNQQHYRDH